MRWIMKSILGEIRFNFLKCLVGKEPPLRAIFKVYRSISRSVRARLSLGKQYILDLEFA